MKVKLRFGGYLLAIMAASTLLSIGMDALGIGTENTLMIYLLGVLLVSAVTPGYIYSAAASVFSILLFNYFFTEPRNTLFINNIHDLILMVFFLIASVISSTMTSKFRYQTSIAQKNEHTASLLYEINQGFLNLTGTESIIRHAIDYIKQNTGYESYVELLESQISLISEDTASHNRILLRRLPILGRSGQLGSIEIFGKDMQTEIPGEKDMLIKSVVNQLALMLDREFIYNEREKIRVAMENEHLKSTLLRSISHDLRTPLTGIVGAAGLILDNNEALTEDAKKALISDINEEASRLCYTVQNILDMTRISEGKLVVQKSMEAADDIVNEAIIRVPNLTKSGRLEVMMPDEILLVPADGRLIVQALVNLLDNAYKHTPLDTLVKLRVYKLSPNIIFEVSDEGEGIDPGIKNTLFDSFVTRGAYASDGKRGMGLGLAICRAIANAHNGSIEESANPPHGALFRMILPLEERNDG